MGKPKTITINGLAEIGECPCEVCSSQDEHPFLTATKEELDRLPPLDKEVEDELRIVARKLRKRVEEDWEEKQLQIPLKEPNLKNR